MKATADLTFLRRVLAREGRAVLLIRHSERYSLPVDDGTFGSEVSLTPHGLEMARAFGAMLGPFRSVVFLSSPMRRCRQTAACIAEGMGLPGAKVTPAVEIGGDNLFFASRRKVFETMRREGAIETMTRYLLKGRAPGHNPLRSAAAKLDLWLKKSRREKLAVIVSHDSVCAEYFVGTGHAPDFSATDWVPYLGGVLLTRLPRDAWRSDWFAPEANAPALAFRQ